MSKNDPLASIKPFKLRIEDNTLFINDVAVARVHQSLDFGDLDQPNDPDPRWKIRFIPINSDGTEGEPINLNCSITMPQKGNIMINGIEISRQIRFTFSIQIGLSGCKISGMYGQQRILATPIRNPFEAVSIIARIIKQHQSR